MRVRTVYSELLELRERGSSYCTGEIVISFVRYAPSLSASSRGGGGGALLFIHRLYVGFMRRQMEEKHDRRVFIVNVRDFRAAPRGRGWPARSYYFLPRPCHPPPSPLFLPDVLSVRRSCPANVLPRHVLTLLRGGLSALVGYTTRRGITLNSTQPAIAICDVARAHAYHALSFSPRDITADAPYAFTDAKYGIKTVARKV